MGAMKMCIPAMRRFLKLSVMGFALVVAGGMVGSESAGAQDSGTASLPGVTMTPAKVTDLMKGSKSCVQHNWNSSPVCCLYGAFDTCILWANEYPIDYWEPSELIEVSCRQGYSMMKPGIGGRSDARIQSCVGMNKPGGGRYFFEARVWAIDGAAGGVRHQAMGGNLGAQTKHCTMEKLNQIKFDIPVTISEHGYGIKWNKFSRGPKNGPGGSWSAYVSDNDPAWAKDDGAGGSVPTMSECKAGSTDLANCWGPTNPTGWVTHSNPKVAAALVAWRAHLKARSMNKTSPADGKGYQMAMEFPFIKYGGEFAGSMGAPNGGKSGSKCFKPGDSGPDWYGGMAPTAIPDFVKGLQSGDVASVAEINPGVYIFTIWVHTSCIRYDPLGGPTPLCKYKGLS